MNIKDRIKHAVFEDDQSSNLPEHTPQIQVPVYNPATIPGRPTYTDARPWSSTSVEGPQDDLYEKLKKNTSFEFATTIQHLIELQKPLEEIIPDPTTRLKAAYAQAKSQKSVCDGDIDHDLTKLENMIEAEANKFHDSIDREKQSITADEAHAVQMEQQLHDLRVAIADKKTKLDRADTGFQAALSRRRNDLTELKGRFAILK